VSKYETDLNEFQTKLKEYEQKELSYKEKINVLSTSIQPGETEDLYRLRKINETNPEKFEIAKKIYFGNMSDLDYVKESMKLTPGLDKFTDEQLNNYLKGQYVLDLHGVDPEDPEAVDERKRRIDQDLVKLGIDSAKAKRELLSSFGEIKIPTPKTPEQVEAENKDRVASFIAEWNPVFDGVKQNKLEVSLSLDEDPSNGQVNLEIPADVKQKYIAEYGQALFVNGVKLDDKTRGSVTDYIRTRFINENLPLIIRSVAKTARELSDDHWMKLSYNTQLKPGEARVPQKGASSNPTVDEARKAFGLI
jgi:hypothetical protein